jgi:hypothetical protein
MAPSGTFCSEPCKQKYEQFIQRAQQLEAMRRPKGLFTLALKRFLGKSVVYLLLILFALVVATVVFQVRIPILSPVVGKILRLIGS